MAKPHLTKQPLKMKDRKVGLVWGRVGTSGRGRIKRECEEGQILLMYFVFMYETRMLKLF
jgi:hypothetical protein